MTSANRTVAVSIPIIDLVRLYLVAFTIEHNHLHGSTVTPFASRMLPAGLTARLHQELYNMQVRNRL